MSLLNPSALWLSLLAVPLIALYALRVRPPRMTVATTMFWESRLQQSRPRAPSYRPRDLVSLMFQLALLALFVVALAEPRFNGQDTTARRIVIVLDNSASMKATDVRPSRFAIARKEAERLLDTFAGEGEAAIITAAGLPRVVCRPTRLRSMSRKALAKVFACDTPARLGDAIQLAARIPHEGQQYLFVISDQPQFDCDRAAFDQVHVIPVGDVADNVAITRFQARRGFNDPLGYDVLIEIRSFSRQLTKCRLELTLNDKLIDAVPLELRPGEQWNRVLSELSADGGRLRARLVHHDALASDNVAWSILSQRRPRQVYLVTPGNPFLREALNAQPRVALHVSDTVPDYVEPDAIIVLYRQSVESIPRGRVLVIEPVSSTSLWECGSEVASPYVAEQSKSPLLRHVPLGDIAFRGGRQLELNAPCEVLLRTLDDNPLLFVVRRNNGKVVVLNTDLDQGDLPLRTAFPILIGNALTWLTDSMGELPRTLGTGDFVEFASGAGTFGSTEDKNADLDRRSSGVAIQSLSFAETPRTVTLRSPSGRIQQQSVWLSRHSMIGPLDECGVWKIAIEATSENAGSPPIEVACNLDNVRESNLLAADRARSRTNANLGTTHHPVWMFAVLGALVLTLTEWSLYHRRWIA